MNKNTQNTSIYGSRFSGSKVAKSHWVSLLRISVWTFLLSSLALGPQFTQAEGVVGDLAVTSQEGLDVGEACTPGTTTLCLHRGRFSVEVSWRDFDDDAGMGTVVLGSEDSGLFWFFNADNWEMLAKVIDACAFNERFWVFSAATTNVEYSLRVIDHPTASMKEYTNALGNSAAATTDTNAFDVCGPPLSLALTVTPAVINRTPESLLEVEAFVVDEEGLVVAGETVHFSTTPSLGVFDSDSLPTNSNGRTTTTLLVTPEDLAAIGDDGTFTISAQITPRGRLPTGNAEVTVTVLGPP